MLLNSTITNELCTVFLTLNDIAYELKFSLFRYLFISES